MNLVSVRVALRLRSVPELLDLAFRWNGLVWRDYARLSLVTLLPLYVACLLLRFRFGAPWWSVWLVAVAVGGVLQGAFTIAAGRLLFDERVSVRASLWQFAQRLPAYGLDLVLSRIVIAFTAMTVVLLPIGAARVLMVHELSLLERAPPLRATGRASRFVRDHQGAAVGLSCALLLTQAAYALGLQILCVGVLESGLQVGAPGQEWAAGGTPYLLAGYLASLPYVASARFLHYIDLRTRKEGWDIALRFRALVDSDRGGLGAEVEVGAAPRQGSA